MAQIFNLLKEIVTPELISKASSMLGEDKSKVSSAVGSIIPTLLGSLLSKGSTPSGASTLESTLMAAGKEHDGIMENLGSLFSGNSSELITGIGSKFINMLFGDKLSSVTSAISSHSGISSEGIGKLISMISPLVAGFLGNKMRTGGLNLSGLLGMLSSEKNSFMSAIPSGLTSALGLSSLNDLGKTTKHVTHTASKEVKKGFNWLWVLLPLLLLAAVLFFWKSCTSKPAEDITVVLTDEVEDAVDSAKNAVESTLADFTLLDGTKLSVLKGGLEDQMIQFLGSDEYKNATEEQLKTKWFNFDKIEFVFGSATELTPESKAQLDNIVAVLKNQTDAKIKIGAYTDKVGNPQENLKLSQKRADTIKDILTKSGVGSQIAGAEGYGDKYATQSASASDEERAVDRKIALRFVK